MSNAWQYKEDEWFEQPLPYYVQGYREFHDEGQKKTLIEHKKKWAKKKGFYIVLSDKYPEGKRKITDPKDREKFVTLTY